MANHQTALIIDARKGLSGKYANRVQRLLQSVSDGYSGTGIKVDVYTMTDTLRRGRPENPNGEIDLPAGPVDLKSWAKKAGYAMVIMAVKP